MVIVANENNIVDYFIEQLQNESHDFIVSFINEFCSLSGFAHTVTLPPKKHLTAMKTVLNGLDVHIPWELIIPKTEFNEWTAKILEYIKSIALRVPQKTIFYYLNHFKEGQYVIDSMTVPTFNIEHLQAAQFAGKKQTISSLKRKISYERFSTRTGRLTVVDGPRILTMPKQLRQKAFIASEKNKSIVTFDYISLDPRVALSIAGSSIANEIDIYERLKTFTSSKNRDDIKKTTMIALYGHENESDISHEINRTEICTRLIESQFKTERGDAIINFFGRPTFPASLQNYGKLFGAFIQSTSTDASLIGFSRGLRALDKISIQAKPLYILHDELAVEIDNIHIDEAIHVFKNAAQNTGLSATMHIKHNVMLTI